MAVKKRAQKRIFLASGSPHRKKLLQLAGFRFTVKPSHVKEKTKITSNCPSLVKENALRKARDIAGRIKDGIVIGADTVAYLGKKRIVGKPRTLREAKRKLKILSSHPQWLYTGIAVVDAKTKKTLVDYEKTKVTMRRLSPKEIDRYYTLISPFDKAGGFDIEGKGSLFIKKIEGCYFNVVGLPVAKLCEMLKKFGITVLSFVLIVYLTGCATEYNLATNKEEFILYGTEKEVRIGENMAKQFDEKFEINRNAALNQRVLEIGRRITNVCDRNDIVYTFKIINEDEVNAVSLPGGFIYIYKGLIDRVANDDQLASVIAHEVGHITAKHGIKRLQSLYGYTFLKLLAVQSKSADLVSGIDAAFASAFMEYSLEDELMADRLAVKYLKKAGYKVEEMSRFLEKLREIGEKKPSRQFSYWRTHPHISKRISAANQAAQGRMEFRDYLNLMGE